MVVVVVVVVVAVEVVERGPVGCPGHSLQQGVRGQFLLQALLLVRAQRPPRRRKGCLCSLYFSNHGLFKILSKNLNLITIVSTFINSVIFDILFVVC